jgi:hypothetical protein
MHCLQYILLKISNHDFRKFFEVIVYNLYAILANSPLPDSQYAVFLHEFLLVDLVLFSVAHQFLVVPLPVDEKSIDLDY